MSSSTTKPTIWLVACVLITCYNRHGTRCLATQATTGVGGGGSSPSSGPLGLAFTANDEPLLVGNAHYKESEGVPHQLENEQQQQDQEPRAMAAGEDDQHWQTKRLRLEESDDSGGVNQLSPKESLRRHRIDQLLEALSSSIPSAPRSRSSGGQSLPRAGSSSSSSGEPQQAPIFRSGRTFPANGPGVGLFEARREQQARRPYEPRERWQSGNMLDGRTGARTVGHYGIVWPANPSGGTGGSTGSGGQLQSRTRLSASMVQSMNKQPRSYALEELTQQINELTDIYRPYQIPDGSGSRKSHRSGTEEFAIQTPIHSQSSGDYETKRVENSRGWNNLRGMWGKRSVLPSMPVGDEGGDGDTNRQQLRDAVAQSIRSM